jgi:alpha-L-fucosidase
MLGSDDPIKWEFTKEALVVTTPKVKPCEHAYVFKIMLKSAF